MGRKITYSFIDRAWFEENWLKTTKSLKQLADELGISDSLLETRASKLGITKHLQYPFNKNKFYNLNDPHLWYIAGLMATDGYMVYNNDSIEFSLTGDSEHDLLESIRDYYEYTHPVVAYGKQYKTWRLRISDYGIQQFFIDNFGLTKENKTFTVGVPKTFPNEDCVKAYILGCFDGDGSIGLKSMRLELTTASETFVKGIWQIILDYTGIDTNYHLNYYKQRDTYYPQICIYGEPATKLLSWVYSVSNCFRLSRKYENFNNLLNLINSKLKLGIKCYKKGHKYGSKN